MQRCGPLTRIVSGGQTGVDRAALDVALRLGLACGGWCPKGRKAEDGPLRERYPLKETPSAAYAQRTRWNVRDSDGTMALNRGTLRGGTAMTVELARRLRKPCLILDLDTPADKTTIRKWLAVSGIEVLNVAGPRESQQPGIYRQTSAFLENSLTPKRVNFIVVP